MKHDPQHPLSWQFLLGGVIIIVLGYIVTNILFGPNPPPPLETTLSIPTVTPVNQTAIPVDADMPSLSITQTVTLINNCATHGLYLEGDGGCVANADMIEISTTPNEKLNAYTEQSNLRNFSIEVRTKIIQNDGNATYGLFARRVDDCQYYLLLVIPSQNKLELKENLCKEGGLKTLNSSDLTFDPYSEHLLKLEVSGGSAVNIIVSVNNNIVFTYLDSVGIVWQGYAGLTVEDAVVQFSVPIVTQITSP